MKVGGRWGERRGNVCLSLTEGKPRDLPLWNCEGLFVTSCCFSPRPFPLVTLHLPALLNITVVHVWLVTYFRQFYKETDKFTILSLWLTCF